MLSRIEAVPEAGTDVASLLADRARRLPDHSLVEVPDGTGWRPVPAAEFQAHVTAVAAGLIALGIGPHQPVGIMSRTRYEWMLVDFALWQIGAVPVPIYETASAAQVEWIARDAELVAVVAETADHARVVGSVCPDLVARERLWVVDDGAIDMITKAGASLPRGEVAARQATIRPEDVATIVYTSGTSGRPKGAELTHANLTLHVATVASTLRDVVATPDARLLLPLPLAHAYARVIELVCVASHTTIGHCPDPATLTRELASFRPTFLVVVPRVLEKIHAAAENASGTGWRHTIFRWAAAMAVAYSRALQTWEGPSRAAKVCHAVADVLVYRTLRQALGGALRQAIVGGSAMREPLAHFYRGIGLDLLEGYGLTETSAPTTVNRPCAARIGSVGLPFPGTEVTVAPDGEVLVRGPNVFRGYHRDPGATARAFREGWLRTGDLGRLDSRGNLFITGRIKELIVTAGGKNVSPTVLEDGLRTHPLVAECVVVGDGRPFVGALVALDPDALPGWCARHRRRLLTLDEAREDPEIRASLQRGVDATNLAVSRAEAIRAFRILDRPLTVESGHLTPSLKVRRDVVLTEFAPVVDSLYDRSGLSVGPGAATRELPGATRGRAEALPPAHR